MDDEQQAYQDWRRRLQDAADQHGRALRDLEQHASQSVTKALTGKGDDPAFWRTMDAKQKAAQRAYDHLKAVYQERHDHPGL